MDTPAIVERFAQNIRYAMQKHRLTQTRIAKKMRCHQSFVSDVVNGKRAVRLQTAERFARAIDMELWHTLMPPKRFAIEFKNRHRELYDG